jgi:hypothetical protein
MIWKFSRMLVLCATAAHLSFGAMAAEPAMPELRAGLWAGAGLSALPLPTSGYEVYLVGEMHGVSETEEIVGQYLELLSARNGLRDVALEEKGAYEPEAQAFVEGKAESVPEALCLRVGILGVLRRFNAGQNETNRVRVHLVDIDFSAASIRDHMARLKQSIPGAPGILIPSTAELSAEGFKTIEAMRKLTADPGVLGELRTIEYSIRAHEHGLEVGNGQFKGSPYLDDREEAIANNVRDLVRRRDCQSLLVLYGNDHVSRTARKDGGEKRNEPFKPMALRLRDSGVKAFSILTFPLSGGWRWRGRTDDMVWTASDGSLADGEKLDHVLASAPGAAVFYADRKRQRLKLPSQDLSAYEVDAVLLLPHATPVKDDCAETRARPH